MIKVIALPLRSNFPLGIPNELLPSHPLDSLDLSVMVKDDKEKGFEEEGKLLPLEAGGINTTKVEADFCTALNSVLPSSIRAIGWTPVTDKFSARFSASR
jgi:hypothetical protein